MKFQFEDNFDPVFGFFLINLVCKGTQDVYNMHKCINDLFQGKFRSQFELYSRIAVFGIK